MWQPTAYRYDSLNPEATNSDIALPSGCSLLAIIQSNTISPSEFGRGIGIPRIFTT